MATSNIKKQTIVVNRTYSTQISNGGEIVLTEQEKQASLLCITLERYGYANFGIIGMDANWSGSSGTPIPGHRSMSISKNNNNNIVVHTTSTDALNVRITAILGGGNIPKTLRAYAAQVAA